jgi:hypothetical protein
MAIVAGALQNFLDFSRCRHFAYYRRVAFIDRDELDDDEQNGQDNYYFQPGSVHK